MTAQDRVEKLHIEEAVSWQSPLCPQTIGEKEKMQLKRAMEAVPGQRIDWIILPLVTETWRERREELLQPAHSRNRHRTELIIDIEQLHANPTNALNQLLEQFEEDDVFPLIRYQTSAGIDRVGVDAGGISRSFVSDLMKALCHPNPPNQRKLPMTDTEKGLIPKVNHSRELPSYRSIGMICAAALDGFQNILIGHRFNPTLFQMIYALTRAEITQLPANLSRPSDIPQAIQNKLLKLYFKSELRLVFGPPDMTEEDLDLAIHNFVERDVINEWMKDISSITDKTTFLSERELDRILLATVVIGQSVQQRIEEPRLWDTVKGTSAKEFQKKIEGSLSKELVMAALSCQEPDDLRMNFVRQWINDATMEALENFVLCISGSTTLTEEQTLTINLQAASSIWPTFHTCSFTMDVPRYDTYEVFRNNLHASIAYIVAGNSIGMA